MVRFVKSFRCYNQRRHFRYHNQSPSLTKLLITSMNFQMTMAAPIEKLQQLETIEKDIATVLQSAGQAIQELSKDKPNSKVADTHTVNFLKALESVENGLFKQINYLTQVSTGQPHEGSSYAAQKVLQMAWHRLEHARSKVNELERLKNQHTQAMLRQAGMRQSLNTN